MFEVTDKLIHGFHVLKITEGKFKDVEFCYGAVNILENDDDSATLQYDYDVITGNVDDIEEFNKLTGQILQNILEEQVKTGEVIYAGGTDDE